MNASLRRLAFWSVPAAALAAAFLWAFWPRAMAVDLATVERGDLVVAVSEEGRTRIADVYTVSAPLSGLKRRIDLEAGDVLIAGETVVAEIAPADPEFLDMRSTAEAEASAEAARAALALSRARLVEAKAELDFAVSEVDRYRTLQERGAVSARALQDAERLFLTREASVATAEAAINKARSELVAAEMRLLLPTDAMARGVEGCPCVPILAPVSGRVLRVLRESEGVVAAGEPLIEIGDPDDLEVVAEFLSADAVRIRPGLRVEITDWGGPPLAGTVARVEPYAFTKVSALGIEEQRVKVEIDFDGPPDGERRRLGHGFQVEARVVLEELQNVVRAPLTALLRQDGAWAVFAVEDGVARLRDVALGAKDDHFAAVLKGLQEGEQVVAHPHQGISDGTRLHHR